MESCMQVTCLRLSTHPNSVTANKPLCLLLQLIVSAVGKMTALVVYRSRGGVNFPSTNNTGVVTRLRDRKIHHAGRPPHARSDDLNAFRRLSPFVGH
ncbi:hypothetical protein BaRGS_00012630 [Batillaria attramentaria]|uniref:Secreted protein n=1 Tax=Batillaria attramentaria TaxID=370345 RepID=A0ABD0LA24_9CAEN